MNTDRPSMIARGEFIQLSKRGRWEYAERIGSSGAAVIITLTDDNKMVFVQQFRIPVQAEVIENPAGLVGDVRDGETREEAARVELLEETGYEAKTMEYLTEGPKSPGMINEEVSIFLATGLTKVASGGGDGTENIKVHEIPFNKVDSWVQKKIKEGIKVDPGIFAGLYFAGKEIRERERWLAGQRGEC